MSLPPDIAGFIDKYPALRDFEGVKNRLDLITTRTQTVDHKIDWEEDEVSGTHRDPSKLSLEEVLRPGAEILEVTDRWVKIKFKTGSIVKHERRPASERLANSRRTGSES